MLKILQKHYYGKIKMIYIDPPYNTGHDFVYSDDYSDPIGKYLEQTGQKDGQGRLSTNVETNGRFHSNWLSMMYPRLKLARNLLSEDGLLCISIDDRELAGVMSVCCEIFGESNYVDVISWQNLDTVKNDARYFSSNHEYILVFARMLENLKLRGVPKGEKQRSYYKNLDGDPRGPYLLTPLHAKSGSAASLYEYTFANGQTWSPPKGTFARFKRETLESLERDGRIFLDPNGVKVPQRKTFLSEVGDRMPATTFWGFKDFGSTRNSNKEVAGLVGAGVFPNPKPTKLLKTLVDLVSYGPGFQVLDFFAGSGTTAHAVMALNAEDGGNRRCISVQLPEATDEKSEARKAGYSTISEITRERIRRAGKKILEEEASKLDVRAEPLDVGFRAYRLVDTNFAKWRADSSLSADELGGLFTQMSETADDDARPDALLTEVLLKLGFSLTERIERREVDGLEAFEVADGLLVAYLNERVKPTLEQLRSLVSLQPARLVLLEDAFQGDDELKTNLVQECRTHSVDLWTV